MAAAPGAPAGASTSAADPSPTCTTRGVGVGIVDIPSGSRDPRAQTYVVDHVKAGAEFARRFQVCNGTARPLTVKLYAGAATITGGAFRVTEGRAANELTSWTRVEPAQVSIPPGRRVLARASFAVPADAPSGERYGVLLAELPSQAAGSGVAVANRVGVRVYLNVGPGAAPSSDFRVDSLQARRDAAGTPTVTAAVHNTGRRALDLSGSLALTDGPGGLSGGPFPAQLGTTLAPGDTAPVTVPLDKAIRGGPWTAVLTLRSGLLERRAQARITFPEGAGVQAPPVQADNLPFSEKQRVPLWTAAGLIFILALLLLVIGYLTSRRKARERNSLSR